jgi:hypothetical protein
MECCCCLAFLITSKKWAHIFFIRPMVWNAKFNHAMVVNLFIMAVKIKMRYNDNVGKHFIESGEPLWISERVTSK